MSPSVLHALTIYLHRLYDIVHNPSRSSLPLRGNSRPTLHVIALYSAIDNFNSGTSSGGNLDRYKNLH